MTRDEPTAADAASNAADLLDEWASLVANGEILPAAVRGSLQSLKRGLDAIDRGLVELAKLIERDASNGVLYHEDEAFHGDGNINGPKLRATVIEASTQLRSAAESAGAARDAVQEAGHAVHPIGRTR